MVISSTEDLLMMVVSQLLFVKGTKERSLLTTNGWSATVLAKFKGAHINVEYCNLIKSIKYVCKYINKGTDQAVFTLPSSDRDEIADDQHGRYICSSEALWRIFSFPIHERYPTVVHLSVNLENGQRIYFTEENLHHQIESHTNSTLTAFFQLCQEGKFAKTLLYVNVPKYYTWCPSTKKYSWRAEGTTVEGFPGIKASDALGRVYTVHPNNFECFCLRLLLHHVDGPTTFHDLRTVNGHICETFREACNERDLLEDDNHWNATLTEAAATYSPNKLRYLFAIMMCSCGLSNPKQLWETHKDSLSEDILHHVQQENQTVEVISPALTTTEHFCYLKNWSFL